MRGHGKIEFVPLEFPLTQNKETVCDVYYKCYRNHAESMDVFICALLLFGSTLRISDVSFTLRSRVYPSEILFELTNMLVEEAFLYADDHDCSKLSITGSVPFLPEILVDKGFRFITDPNSMNDWSASKVITVNDFVQEQ